MSGPEELQRWDCYVEEIDEAHVHLMMMDVTSGDEDGREIGSFPRHLLDHLSPVEGQLVTVRVMSDERILIENTKFSEEDRERGRRSHEELIELLRILRERSEDD